MCSTSPTPVLSHEGILGVNVLSQDRLRAHPIGGWRPRGAFGSCQPVQWCSPFHEERLSGRARTALGLFVSAWSARGSRRSSSADVVIPVDRSLWLFVQWGATLGVVAGAALTGLVLGPARA